MAGKYSSLYALCQAADQLPKEALAFEIVKKSLEKHLPLEYTWQDLASEIASPAHVYNPQFLQALRVCLCEGQGRLKDGEAADIFTVEKAEGDDLEDRPSFLTAEAARRQISQFVARAMSPVVAVEGAADRRSGDDDEDDAGIDGDEQVQQRRLTEVTGRCRTLAASGVAVLEQLFFYTESSQKRPLTLGQVEPQAVFALIAALEAGQAWTTAAAAAQAEALIGRLWRESQQQQAPADTAEWVVETVFQSYLRPLFARSQPASITASGRRATYSDSNSNNNRASRPLVTETAGQKPWKYSDLRALAVFAWTVETSDVSLIGHHWSFFTPVLLTLLDDATTDIRCRGLELLGIFVSKLLDGGKGELLQHTGLDRVFADAVFPTLLFLPRLTPEKESVQLLPPAYGALRMLVRAASSSTGKSAADRSDETGPDKASLLSKPALALLDRLLREGIFAGYFHANEYIAVVEVLICEAGHIVDAMGLYAVKHLKDLIPLYAGILTDPFAMRYKPALVATLDTLQTTLANCWPRIANTPWQGDITKMLMLCWLNFLEDRSKRGGALSDDVNAQLEAGLVRAAASLMAILRAANVDVSASIGSLVAKEPHLSGLFPLDGVKTA